MYLHLVRMRCSSTCLSEYVQNFFWACLSYHYAGNHHRFFIHDSSTLTLYVYIEPDCKGDPIGKTLVYSQDNTYGGDGDIQNVEKFSSFWLSRPLQDQEQLDLSHSGRDVGQSQVWPCGEYVINFRMGTGGGCHKILSGGTAQCIRLWHY